jgi:hypothetical protein
MRTVEATFGPVTLGCKQKWLHLLHSTLAIFLETKYQAKWQPDEGFIEGGREG